MCRRAGDSAQCQPDTRIEEESGDPWMVGITHQRMTLLSNWRSSPCPVWIIASKRR